MRTRADAWTLRNVADTEGHPQSGDSVARGAERGGEGRAGYCVQLCRVLGSPFLEVESLAGAGVEYWQTQYSKSAPRHFCALWPAGSKSFAGASLRAGFITRCWEIGTAREIGANLPDYNMGQVRSSQPPTHLCYRRIYGCDFRRSYAISRDMTRSHAI